MEEARAEAADLGAVALTAAALEAADLEADPAEAALAAVLADREVPVGDMAAIGARALTDRTDMATATAAVALADSWACF